MAIDVVITPEKTEKWINRSLRKRHPECEPDFRVAWGAFLRCLERGRVEDTDLALVIGAARNKKAVLWQSAVEWLRQLVPDHLKVQEEVRKMATDPLSHVRFSGLCCVSRRSLRPFQLEVLLPAIDDRSSEVRWKAVDRLSHFGISEAIPLIEKRRAIEKNAKVSGVIDFELPLLIHGFVAKPVARGVDLIVKGIGGTVSRVVPQAEIDAKGLSTIVRQHQETLSRDALVLRYVPKAAV